MNTIVAPAHRASPSRRGWLATTALLALLATPQALLAQATQGAGATGSAAPTDSAAQAPGAGGQCTSRAQSTEATAEVCGGKLRITPSGASEPMPLATPAPAERVFVLDGALWVRLADGRTLAVSALLRQASAATAAPAPTTTPPATPAPTAQAQVAPTPAPARPVAVAPSASAYAAPPAAPQPPAEQGPGDPLRFGSAKLLGLQWTVNGRPFIGDSMLGLAIDASVTYRMEHTFLRFQVNPLVGTLGTGPEAEDTLLFGFAGFVGFDHRLFDIGVGVGAGKVQLYDDADFFGDYVTGIGLTVWQTVRAGRIDGLHMVLRNAFVYLDRKIRHHALSLEGSVPFSRAAALVLRTFNSGTHGYYHGEMGMRLVLARDERGVATTLVTPTIGFVVNDWRGAERGGGYVGFGAEWRTAVKLDEPDPEEP